VVKKALALLIVVVGLATFFLPLVRIQAPLVGTQKLSGWDVVKPEEKKARRDLGLGETLEKLQGDFLRRKRREAPLSVKQAEALVVTLPLAYLSLALGAVWVLLRKARPWQATAAVGLLAGVYSLLSVFWLSRGLQAMVAGRGSDRSLFGLVRRSVAGKVDVSPEIGLYLLAGALAAMLVASLFLVPKRS
jgi:hypothetical protein